MAVLTAGFAGASRVPMECMVRADVREHASSDAASRPRRSMMVPALGPAKGLPRSRLQVWAEEGVSTGLKRVDRNPAIILAH